jgi:hypothetical protein
VETAEAEMAEERVEAGWAVEATVEVMAGVVREAADLESAAQAEVWREAPLEEAPAEMVRLERGVATLRTLEAPRHHYLPPSAH